MYSYIQKCFFFILFLKSLMISKATFICSDFILLIKNSNIVKLYYLNDVK